MDYRLTDIAREEIDALIADGITPTAQEVLDIQRLSEACAAPDAALGSLARGKPVTLGVEVVWPPTIAAAAFIEEVGPLASDEVERFYIFAYACRFGRDASRIYERGAAARDNARAWRRRLRCTNLEAVEAIEALTADTMPSPPGKEMDAEERRGALIDLALRAAALVGGSPEVWETQAAIPAVARVIDLAYEQKRAEGKSAKHDPRIAAVRALGEYVLALREARKAAANGI